MTNTEAVRNYVLKQFQSQMDVPFRNIGLEHTLQVVSYALILAKQRNLDEELLMIAAYFHDLATYQSHYANQHALRSSQIAKEILPLITKLSPENVLQIITAIKNHSNKESIDDPLSEALKDADVLSHYYSGNVLDDIEKNRLKQVDFFILIV